MNKELDIITNFLGRKVFVTAKEKSFHDVTISGLATGGLEGEGVRTSPFVAKVTSYLVIFIRILQHLYFIYPIPKICIKMRYFYSKFLKIA